MRSLLLLALAPLAFAGCSEGPEDCGAGEDFNPHEERCVQGGEGDAEVCNAWVAGSAGDGPSRVSCQARSDGKAWLDSTVDASHGFRIEVRDGGGAAVYARDVQFAGSTELAGAPGAWTLTVDFRDVAASGRVVLWG